MPMKLPVHAVTTALFSVPAERVFDAWLDTGKISQFMFGPGLREESIVQLSNEPRPAGRFSYIVQRGDEIINHVGEYIEIDRPKRLTFTWAAEDDDSPVSLVVIEIAPIQKGCELTLTHEMASGWEDFVERSKIAWGKMLDKLTEIL
jgi:uncharacterized protein YndB with AHSA1/START domain